LLVAAPVVIGLLFRFSKNVAFQDLTPPDILTTEGRIMALLSPHNVRAWTDEHRDQLKPPVGNKMVWQDTEFLVMVVGGPNRRKDYHVEEGEELFYQVEGDITLRGEIFLLPPRIPHSPQRPEDTVGMVVERVRKPGELDHLVWFCDGCGETLHDASFELRDLGMQLKPIIEGFYSDETLRTCKKCGDVMQVPAG
jgi:3-hydroxyanthranilate 3,4-dioxygenase